MMVIATIIKPTSLFHEVRGWNAGLPISSKVTRGGGFESDLRVISTPVNIDT